MLFQTGKKCFVNEIVRNLDGNFHEQTKKTNTKLERILLWILQHKFKFISLESYETWMMITKKNKQKAWIKDLQGRFVQKLLFFIKISLFCCFNSKKNYFFGCVFSTFFFIFHNRNCVFWNFCFKNNFSIEKMKVFLLIFSEQNLKKNCREQKKTRTNWLFPFFSKRKQV